jgi:L-ascorbate metabolism protein UlaG (beta-lactamase superfamily)
LALALQGRFQSRLSSYPQFIITSNKTDTNRKHFMTELNITFVGHATVLLEMNGTRILTDPILRDKIMHLRRGTQPFESNWHQNIDAVLISHMHYDHLDLPSLEKLGKSMRLIVPNGMAAMLHRRGFTHVEELTRHEATTVGSLTIRATHAAHDRARFRHGPAADTLGFVMEGQHTAYFPGDTDIFPEMVDLAGTLDVALMPVWGWGPTLGKGHLDPYRAAMALQLLKPRLAVPIHWGTLSPLGMRRFNPGFLADPPHSFARFAAQLAPEVTVRILRPGSSLRYHKNGSTDH